MSNLPTKAPTVESTMPKHEEPKASKPTKPSNPVPKNPSSAGPAPWQGKKDPATGGIIYDTSKKSHLILVSKILTKRAG